MIERILSCLFCLGKLKFTHFLGKKRVSENLWSKIWNPGAIVHMLGQHLEYVSTFGGKCQPLVGRVNYDRPFMDHIVRKKTQFFLKIASKVNYDRLLVNYDRPIIGYIGRKKWHGKQGKLWSTDGKLWSTKNVELRVYGKEKKKKGKFRV